MTMPREKSRAVLNTREFLSSLLDPKKTPGVPKVIRQEAYRCLKHYPASYDIENTQEKLPEIWGDKSET